MSQHLTTLYIVIQAMTPNQKKSFTLQYNSVEPNGSSLVLFNALNKFEKYDKERLIKYLLKNNEHELVENLSEEAATLYNLILEKLMSIASEKSAKKRLRNTFNEIVLLQEMGCLTRAEQMLKKLKKDAIEYDLKAFLMEVYEYECNIKRDANNFEAIQKIKERIKGLRKNIYLENELIDVYDNVFYLAQNFSRLKKSDAQIRLTEIETNLNKTDRNQCNCFGTQRLYLYSLLVLEHLKCNKEAVFKYIEEIQKLFETHQKASKASDFKHTKFLASNLNYFVKYDISIEQFSTTLTEVKSIKANTPYEAMINFSNIYYVEFLYYLKRGDFAKIENLIPSLLKELDKYGDKINLDRRMVFWYNLMIYYFLKQDFRSAYYWIKEKILKYGRKSNRKDFFNKSKLFKLLVCFELEDVDSFEASIKAIKRSYPNKENPNELVNLVVSLINDHYKKAPLDRKNFKAALETFYQIDQSKNQNSPFDEIKIWLKSKVERQSMQKVTEQMFQKK